MAGQVRRGGEAQHRAGPRRRALRYGSAPPLPGKILLMHNWQNSVKDHRPQYSIEVFSLEENLRTFFLSCKKSVSVFFSRMGGVQAGLAKLRGVAAAELAARLAARAAAEIPDVRPSPDEGKKSHQPFAREK